MESRMPSPAHGETPFRHRFVGPLIAWALLWMALPALTLAAPVCPPGAEPPDLNPDLRYFGNLSYLDLTQQRVPEEVQLTFYAGSAFPAEGIDLDVRVYTGRFGAEGPICVRQLELPPVQLEQREILAVGEVWPNVPQVPEIWKSVSLPDLLPDHREQTFLFVAIGYDLGSFSRREYYPAIVEIDPRCDDDGTGTSVSTGLTCGQYELQRTNDLSSLYFDPASNTWQPGLTVEWLIRPVDLESLDKDHPAGRWLEDYRCLKDTHISVHARPGPPPL